MRDKKHDIPGWRYYNHAVMPACAPHETPDVAPVMDGSIWSIRGSAPILVRWTTDWDCGYETEWWYIIKDAPLDIASLKAKRRYEIKKGRERFEVKAIRPSKYVEALLEIQLAAFSSWPEKYRPNVAPDSFRESVLQWNCTVIGGFDKETAKLCAYALLEDHGAYVEFNVLRVIPAYERLGINAAMVSQIAEHYNSRYGDGFYIVDGSRSVKHETHFQDYLEKYFGFRKAYCKLHIRYRPPFGALVNIAFPFRNALKKADSSALLHNINAILKMEEIVRRQH